MKSMMLVNVHFGKYKDYFPLFINSCRNNPTVNFLLVTDQFIDSPPLNVIVKYMTFGECKTRIQKMFDFPINLSSAYDLCDYKVAYGELFGDELANTDFWGYCDTDLVFGNIRKFITDDILDNYDKVLIRGHFTLFRNRSDINTIYRRKLADGTERFKQVFMDDGIHHFDEGLPGVTQGINTLFAEAIGWDKVYDEYVFMDLCVDTFSFINADFKNDKEERRKARHSFFLYDGALFRILQDGHSEEFMYIHFQKRNMKVGNVDLISKKYYIVPNRFVALDEISTAQLHRSNNGRIYWNKIGGCLSGKAKRVFRRLFR